MARFARFASILLLLMLLAYPAAAEPPSRFKLVPNSASLELDHHLSMELEDGDMPEDCAQLVLFLDDIPGLSTKCWYGPEKKVFFQLSRAEKNRDEWRYVLGSPFSHDPTRNMSVSIQLGGKPLTGIKEVSSEKDLGKPTVAFNTYTSNMMTLGLIAGFLIVLIAGLSAKRGSMIRDSVIPQMLLIDRPYSLGRFQMAFWFVLTLAAFLFILAITKDLNSLNPESFILLGISGATALTAVAIDQSKKEQIDTIENKVVAFGLPTLEDVKALKKSLIASKNAASVSPADQKVETARIRDALKQRWDSYNALIAPIRSKGLLRDLVNDVNGPTLHRWQILIWTIVLGTIYVYKVYSDLETPTFGNSLLALMGISSGVYLGFKIPERQVEKPQADSH